MAGHGLGRAYVNLIRILAEYQLEGGGFGQIVQLGSGSVSVEVDVSGIDLIAAHSDSDGAGDLLGGGIGSGNMMSVAGGSVSDYLGEYFSAAGDSVLIFFKYQYCRALAHDEASAAFIEGQGSRVLIGGCRQSLTVAEACDREGSDSRFASAADHCLSGSDGDGAIGFADGGGGGCAGGLMRYAGTLRSEANCDVSGGDVADHLGDELRRNAAGAVVQQILMLGAEGVEAADSGADIYAELLGINLAEDSALFDRFISGIHCVNAEKVGFAYRVLIEARGGIEALDLGCESIFVTGNIEMGDGVDAVFALDQRLGIFLQRVSDRGDTAHSGYDNSIHMFVSFQKLRGAEIMRNYMVSKTDTVRLPCRRLRG